MSKKHIKSISLCLAAVIALGCATACGGQTEPEQTVSQTAVQTVSQTDAQEETQLPDETEPETKQDEEITSEPDSPTETTAVSERTTVTEQTEAETSKPVEAPDLSSTQKILDYYANATAKAVSPKAGFKKYRVGKLDAEPDIPGVVRSAYPDAEKQMKKFMSIKDDKDDYGMNYSAVKGKQSDFAYIQKSTLTANDVKSANYTDKGDTVELRLVLKDGSSDKNTDISTLPLEKCGICSGSKDMDEYDHKNAVILTGALLNLPQKESYDNAVVTATVNKADGTLTALQIEFHTNVQLKLIVNMSASGTVRIQYSDFVY